MKHHKESIWGWLLAVDFFFAGMGGVMIALAGISYLFFGNTLTTLVGNFAGPVFIALGAALLTLELGRPLQAWRVFLNPKAILTFGAWNMTFAIGCGIAFASFGIEMLPWAGWVRAEQVLAILCIFFGLIVGTYPGVMLARLKARPFWSGPGLVNLFMVSSLATALAFHDLANIIIPGTARFNGITSTVLALQIVLWGLYIYVKRTGTTEREALATECWLRGDMAKGFWLNVLGLGSLLPAVLYLLSSNAASVLASVLVLFGGLSMRLMVVKSGEHRTWLPGEEKYRSKLPIGDETFLTLLKK